MELNWFKKKTPAVELTPDEEQRAKDELYNERSEYNQDFQEAKQDLQEFTEEELQEAGLITKELKIILDAKEQFHSIKQDLRAMDRLKHDDPARKKYINNIKTTINTFSNEFHNSNQAFKELDEDCKQSIQAANELQELAQKHELKNKQGKVIRVISKFEEDILHTSQHLGTIANDIFVKITEHSKYALADLEQNHQNVDAEKNFRAFFTEANDLLNTLEAQTKGIARMLKAMQDVAKSVEVAKEIHEHWHGLIKNVGRRVVYDFEHNNEEKELLNRAGILQELERQL